MDTNELLFSYALEWFIALVIFIVVLITFFVMAYRLKMIARHNNPGSLINNKQMYMKAKFYEHRGDKDRAIFYYTMVSWNFNPSMYEKYYITINDLELKIKELGGDPEIKIFDR